MKQGQIQPPGDTRSLFFIQWTKKASPIRHHLTRCMTGRGQGSPVRIWGNAKVHSWKNNRKSEREMTKDENKRRGRQRGARAGGP